MKAEKIKISCHSLWIFFTLFDGVIKDVNHQILEFLTKFGFFLVLKYFPSNRLTIFLFSFSNDFTNFFAFFQ